ncbi:MAG: Wzz/FepE/Etk N-terminal domain-containing protein, partial [Candidatus Aenigmatarchaeota archaeon]
SNNYYEIDIYKLFATIWRRKNILIIIFLVFTLFGTVLSFLLPRVYQARASVMLDFDAWKYYLMDVITTMPQQERVSTLISTGVTKQRNQELTQFVVSALNGYPTKLQIAKKLKQNFGLDIDLSNKNDVEKIYTIRLDKANSNIILISEMKDRKIAETTLQYAIEELDTKAKEYIRSYCKDAYKECEKYYIITFVEKPFSFDKPVKPKRGLIIAISSLVGFTFGIFISLLWDGWVSRKFKEI